MFSKLLLLSVIIMMVAIPMATASDRDYRRGLRRALLLTFAFNIIYFVIIRFIYPRLI
jgi:heme/copper-type cytochrome/quinol oxidase subunit 3